MKRFAAIIGCLAVLLTSVCAYAAEVSVTGVDGNIIKYSVSGGERVISALYCAGKLYSVNEGAGDKIFYAPPEKSCTIKTYVMDKTTGEILDTVVTDNIQTGSAPYLEKLVLFLPDAQLEETANYIHDTAGGDMAEIVPEMAVNPGLYDTVYLVYTAKNGALNESVQKMFETYDFGRAAIVPFIYGEVNGTDKYISTLEPEAYVYDAMNVKYASKQDIADWLEALF